MKYHILSEMEAIQWSYQPSLPKTLIISITCPEAPLPTFGASPQIQHIHRMSFHDLEKAYHSKCQLLTKEQILTLKTVLDTYASRVDEIIIHCAAGISRSAAIGAGIALYLQDSDDFVWSGSNHRRFFPNRHCFTLMNEVLGLGLSSDDIHERYARQTTHHSPLSLDELFL